MSSNLKKRVEAMQQIVSARPTGSLVLGYPPCREGPEYLAWVKKADAWYRKHEGKSFDEAMAEARQRLDEMFPDLD